MAAANDNGFVQWKNALTRLLVESDQMKNTLAPCLAILCIATSVGSLRGQSSISSKESGIYSEIGGSLTMVSSTVVNKASPGGVMANAASLGFKGVDIKSKIDGPKSEVRIKASTPEFLFHGDSFKPNEYSLVKLEAKDDRRELKTGKVGMLGRVKSDVDKDAMVKVKFSKVEDGVWKVSPEKPLTSGEYAFVVSTALPERVWSFGID